jgi:hypothetical protein
MKKTLFLLLLMSLTYNSYSQNVDNETYIVKGKVISKKKYDLLLRRVTINYCKNYIKTQNKSK